MKKIVAILVVFWCFSCKKEPSFEEKVHKIIEGKKSKVGVALIDMENGEVQSVNGNEKFPLLSVFKFHVAAKVLDDVDKGKMSLDMPIPISASQFAEKMYSPLVKEYGAAERAVRLDSLVAYMVSYSDNIACDVLINQIGGAKVVDEYFKNLGIKDMNIEVNEKEMHKDWETQYKNRSTPLAAAEALKKFYLREYLSGESHNFLWARMVYTNTGPNRIKAGIPTGSELAHKTGTSDRNEAGLSAATNDMGIIILPNRKAYVLVVFVSDSMESDETNEKIIADIASAATHEDK